MSTFAPVAFPLWGIVKGKCACKNESCQRVGKHPAVLWRALAFGDPCPRPAPGAGYGLKTGAAPKGSGIFAVDLDGWEAVEEWTRRSAEHGEETVSTYTVKTGRDGGFQLYFQHPGFYVKGSVGELWHNGKPKPEAQGIDIRGDGNMVVGQGSPHRSGVSYELVLDIPPVPAPAWLLDWLRQRPTPVQAQPHTSDIAEPLERERRRELFVKDCQTSPPAVEGRGGDAALFNVVQRGAYDLALPTDDVLEIVTEHYNPRCVPPWDEDALGERVIHKSTDAKCNSTRPRAEPVPAELTDVFSSVEPTRLAHVELPTRAELKAKSDIFWDDWDQEIPEPSWLVQGLIPTSTVGGFVAHGSSLKTWTMLSVGSAIAQGALWLDKFETKQGRVLVLDYESGLYEIRRRVKMLEGGKVPGLGAWSYPGKHVDDIELWKRLAGIEGVSLLCIDSLAAGTSPGVDENGKEAAYPLDLAGRYTEATGASVLFVHHSKKDDGGDQRKAVRGSTAIYAAMDWCYAFEAVEETPQLKRMTMNCIKPCMGAKPMPVPIELSDRGLYLFEGRPELDRGAKDEEVQARILLALQSGPIENVSKIAKVCRISKTRALEEVGALIVRHEVLKLDGFGYCLDDEKSRLARITIQVNGGVRRTEAQIAKAAHVKTILIEELCASGVITKSAEGRFEMRRL